MSEIIDDQGPKPRTRREVLENPQCERGIFGGREIHTTATEPMPEYSDTGYTDVTVRVAPSNGIPIFNRGLFIGTATMVVVSAILFWVPFLNALMAGAFGGFFARNWSRAFKAAAAASVAVPALFAFLYGWDTPDFYYMFYGLGFWGWTALHVVGLFIGAASGVYARPVAERRRFRGPLTGR